MPYRRLILVLCLIAQAVLLIQANHARAGMLKTMREQNDTLEKAVRVMRVQSYVIDAQAKALRDMQEECDVTQDKVVYQ